MKCLSALLLSACLLGSPALAVAQSSPPASLARLDAADPASLFDVSIGTLERADTSDGPVYRWHIPAGQTSTLSLRSDLPLTYHLPLYERFDLQFRVASGSINELRAQASGHVSGPRAYKLFQWDLAIFTTPKGIWHHRSLDLARPSWFPWDDRDGIGRKPVFTLHAMALEHDTVVELRDMAFRKELIRIKPDFELPATWPVLTRHDDGSATYVITHYVQNITGGPTSITLQLTSKNKAFAIGLFAGDKTPALPVKDHPAQVTLEAKANQSLAFQVIAHLSAQAANAMKELESEPVEITFSSPDATAVTWRTQLTRPLSAGLKRQVILGDTDVAAVRKAYADKQEDLLKSIGMAPAIKEADAFLAKELLMLPRGHAHVRNNWVGDWRPGDRMPEAVNIKTGEKQFGSNLASQTWKEYLGHRGGACENLALAYLYTGDEKYAAKAAELMGLYADQYRELDWAVSNDSPWAQGPAVLSSSRPATSSSYGSNWYFKGHCRLLSAITGSSAWTPEFQKRVYEGFVMPYATELMKFNAPISNMSDITNHNILLLGLTFDDANLVRHALLNDAGVLSRLKDIDEEGFSSEGRSINYHLAGLTEAVPSLAYAARAGLKLDLPIDHLAAAVRMPFQRAALTGVIPTSGDAGRGMYAASNPIADQLLELAPHEAWLKQLGRNSTLPMKLAGDKADANAWKSLLETTPRLYRHAGLAILRTGDTPQSQVMVTLDYGRSVFHAHKDRQQITLVALGKVFSQGTGSLYNAGSGVTRSSDARLNSFPGQGSLGQNVILVDTQDQLPAIGKLLAWSDKPDFQLAASEVTGIAPGVSHVRCVALTQGIVVVLDRITGEKQHTFDFIYHNLGTLTPGQGWAAAPQDQPLATVSNYQNLIDLARLQGSGPIHLVWDLTNNVRPAPPAKKGKPAPTPAEFPTVKLDLWQLPAPGGQAYTAVTGINNMDTNRIPDTAPTLIQRAAGNSAFFATVLEPNQGSSRIKAISAAGDDGVTVQLQSGQSITLRLDELLRQHAVK